MPESVNSFIQNVCASRSIVKDDVDGKHGEPETERYENLFFDCIQDLDRDCCLSLSVTLSILLVLECEVMCV